MTVKTKKSAAGKGTVKQTAVGGGIGIGVTAMLAPVLAGIGIKFSNPLSAADTLGAVCVLGGALAAAFAGCKLGKNIYTGLLAGGLYTLVCVIASLFTAGDGNTAVLFGVTVLGVMGGVALARGHKPSTRKKMKKYTRR